MTTAAGRFVTFEGIDGAGKSTHVEALAQWLRDRGHAVVVTREPGGTEFAERLRELLLHTAMDALTEALVVFAARRDHLCQRIEPALAGGATVLCDRYTDATFAYQGGGRGFDLGVLEALEGWVQQGRQPDLTLWFDLPAASAAERRAAVRAPDRFERQDTAFFERVRAGYAARARQFEQRFARIDALPPPAAVWAQIEAAVRGTRLVVSDDAALPLPWLQVPLAAALRQRGHALLLHGAAGNGTLPLALTLAQAWLCEGNAAPAPPCGRCASCRLVQSHLHPDLFVLLPQAQRVALGWPLVDDKPADDKKPSRQIRIGEIRAATDWVQKTAARDRGKVVLLHPAEAINPQAANALLKTLEEPPPGTRLVLTAADPEHLLPTVRSRCQKLTVAAPPADAAARWLAAKGVADAGVLLAATSGRPLDALALAQAGVDGAAWQALPRAVANGQGAALAALSALGVPAVVDALLKLCHDALAVAAGGAARFFPAAGMPAPNGVAPLLAWREALLRVAVDAEHPWNEGLLLDSLLAQGRSALTLAR